MIQIWSAPSTETPTVRPRTQWFGKGFGQSGSTSNRGACIPEASTETFLRGKPDSIPMAASSTANAAACFDRNPNKYIKHSFEVLGAECHLRIGPKRVLSIVTG